MSSYKKIVQEMLAPAGIKINGDQPYDIQVIDDRFYRRIISEGSLGVGESYMAGWWECKDLQGMFNLAMKAGIDEQIERKYFRYLFQVLRAKLFNQQSRRKSRNVAELHYDLSNHLYELMLDKYMIYSCAYWKDAENLDQAQQNKLDLICRKLKLRPGQRVLDIGCGWGGFAKYAAERYGVEVTGITLSEEQANLATDRCRGLDVDIRLQDYRDLNETFDRVVSIGMFEHVGSKNYRQFMQICSACLAEDGIFLLHTIGGNQTTGVTDPWVDKYIFPGGIIPSNLQIAKSFEKLFALEDWHNFGYHYETTLQAWLSNFKTHFEAFEERLGKSGCRMWEYYLNIFAAAFHCRNLDLWQIVLTHPRNATKYISER